MTRRPSIALADSRVTRSCSTAASVSCRADILSSSSASTAPELARSLRSSRSIRPNASTTAAEGDASMTSRSSSVSTASPWARSNSAANSLPMVRSTSRVSRSQYSTSRPDGPAFQRRTSPWRSRVNTGRRSAAEATTATGQDTDETSEATNSFQSIPGAYVFGLEAHTRAERVEGNGESVQTHLEVYDRRAAATALLATRKACRHIWRSTTAGLPRPLSWPPGKRADTSGGLRPPGCRDRSPGHPESVQTRLEVPRSGPAGAHAEDAMPLVGVQVVRPRFAAGAPP